MVNDIPNWAKDLVDPKLNNDENIRSAQVLQESPLGKMAVTYTNERIFLTQKKTLGRSQVYELEPPMNPFADQGDQVTCPDCGDTFLSWNAGDLDTIQCVACGSTIPLSEDGDVVTSDIPDLPDEAAQVPTEVPDTSEEAAEPTTDAAPEEPEPPTPDDEPEPFTVDDYTLYEREVPTGNGGTRTMRYFAKNAPEDGRAIPLPDGYDVGRNERSGLPYLRRASEEEPEGAEETAPDPVLEPDATLLTVRGVGPSFAENLAAAGVTDVDALLDADVDALAGETGISPTRIERWRTLGGLTEVPGVGPATAKRLVRAGIGSADDLASADPEELAEVPRVGATQAQRLVDAAQDLQ